MKKNFFLIFTMLVASCLNAKSFSLQVIQKNTSNDIVFDTSYVVEQTVLDYFFNQGMIVSSNTVLVSKNDERADNTYLLRSLMEAKIGSMDLFIKLYLYYSLGNSPNPTAVLLSNIKNVDVEIVSISNSETLVKESFVPAAVTKTNNNRGGVESFAKEVAMKIKAKLIEKGGGL